MRNQTVMVESSDNMCLMFINNENRKLKSFEAIWKIKNIYHKGNFEV